MSSPGEGLGSTFYFEMPVIVAPTGLRHGEVQLAGTMSVPGLSRWVERPSTLVPGTKFSTHEHRGSTKIFPAPEDGKFEDVVQILPQEIVKLRYLSSNDISNANQVRSSPAYNLKSSSSNAYPWPLTLLVVDDASSNRKMVRRVLDKQRFAVEEAEDGLVAVLKIKQKMERNESPYDVILMDFMMPNMDGPTATSAIRGLGFTGIIIGVTGNHLPEDVLRLTMSGTNTVMSKPLDIDSLTSTISSK